MSKIETQNNFEALREEYERLFSRCTEMVEANATDADKRNLLGFLEKQREMVDASPSTIHTAMKTLRAFVNDADCSMARMLEIEGQMSNYATPKGSPLGERNKHSISGYNDSYRAYRGPTM